MNYLDKPVVRQGYSFYDRGGPAPTGVASAIVLTSKHIGVIRPKKAEAWEGELILLVSKYGIKEQDITDLSDTRYEYFTLNECRKLFEPGTVKYYLVCLNWHNKPRNRGGTPIACAHLYHGKCYDDLDQALEAYENANAEDYA